MELKYGKKYYFEKSIESFNCTFMELKLFFYLPPLRTYPCFNCTFMELKLTTK